VCVLAIATEISFFWARHNLTNSFLLDETACLSLFLLFYRSFWHSDHISRIRFIFVDFFPKFIGAKDKNWKNTKELFSLNSDNIKSFISLQSAVGFVTNGSLNQ
jgi:hypothetical protein